MKKHTERQIDDDIGWPECRIDVAAISGEVRYWSALVAGINIRAIMANLYSGGKRPTQLPVFTVEAPFLTSLGTEPSFRGQK